MKFWRRHKHELNRTEGDDPLPQPPEKKMRYSRSDDILLAKYFFTKPEGTSDKIFQAFGRLVWVAPIPYTYIEELMVHCSTHIILGKDGKNIIGYTKQRSIISFSDCQTERISMLTITQRIRKFEVISFTAIRRFTLSCTHTYATVIDVIRSTNVFLTSYACLSLYGRVSRAVIVEA